jgi:hypothetical protein
MSIIELILIKYLINKNLNTLNVPNKHQLIQAMPLNLSNYHLNIY